MRANLVAVSDLSECRNRHETTGLFWSDDVPTLLSVGTKPFRHARLSDPMSALASHCFTVLVPTSPTSPTQGRNVDQWGWPPASRVLPGRVPCGYAEARAFRRGPVSGIGSHPAGQHPGSAWECVRARLRGCECPVFRLRNRRREAGGPVKLAGKPGFFSRLKRCFHPGVSIATVSRAK